MLEYNGKMYARVSDILSSTKDFTKIPPGVLERKTRIGSEVHQAIADDYAGRPLNLSPEAMGYFESYRVWCRYFQPLILQSERRYYCDKLMITGQIDAIISDTRRGTLLLCDYKTSARADHDAWALQAHFYAYLLSVNHYHVSDLFMFLKLDRDGHLPEICQYVRDDSVWAQCETLVDEFFSAKLP